jgi:hypothetical protein
MFPRHALYEAQQVYKKAERGNGGLRPRAQGTRYHGRAYPLRLAVILLCDEPNDKNRSVFRPASLSSLAGRKPVGVVCLAGRKLSSIFIFIMSIA